MNKIEINISSLCKYSFLAMPLAFAGIPLYIHAPDFYATEFKVSLTSLGIILLLLRLLDAIFDPVIGLLSDKYYIMKKYIINISAFILVSCFFLLFNPLYSNYLLWFSIFIFLSTTSFSILTINLNSLGAVWSRDKNEKTTIVSYREIFSVIGLILAVITPTILQFTFSKKDSFLYLSIILLVLMLLSVITFNIWYNQFNRSIKFKSVNLKFKILPKNTKQFFILYGISMLASSIPAVLVIFFIRDKLDLEQYTGIFLLSYFLSGAIGIYIWKSISIKHGKYKTWFFAMILAVFSFIWASLIGKGDIISYMIICIISGISFGAELSLPNSILADYIQDNKDENNSSLYYGYLAFIAKGVMAIASAITLLYLDFIGFKPSQYNPDNILFGLSVTYAMIPCLIKIMSVYLLWRLLNEKKVINNDRSNNHA